MTCEEAKPLIAGGPNGCGTAAVFSALVHHASYCPECRRLVHEYNAKAAANMTAEEVAEAVANDAAVLSKMAMDPELDLARSLEIRIPRKREEKAQDGPGR